MGKTLEITMKIKNETGETIVESRRERAVPYIGEIERDGFRASFHELESAVLEGRKSASDELAVEYLNHMAKKKRGK